MGVLVPVVPANGPVPRGPYSAGIRAGNLLFVSGQIAIAPDGTSHAGGDLELQTRLCLANLRAVLEAGGADTSLRTRVPAATKWMLKWMVWLQDLMLTAAYFG